MRPELTWINAAAKGQLGIMPRPRGGDWLDGEIHSLAEAGVKVLVSLLSADEVAGLELQDEERLCGECGIHFISFQIPVYSDDYFSGLTTIRIPG